jgi:hypothetical protein
VAADRIPLCFPLWLHLGTKKAIPRNEKSPLFYWLNLVGAVGIELLRALKTRKLLILRNDKMEKNCKNAEPRYTAGTRNASLS